MRKNIFKLIVCCFLLIIMTACSEGKTKEKEEDFYLNDKFYGEANFIEIDADKLNDIIEDKTSFGLFVYQPMCTNSYAFNKVLIDFVNKNQITFYMIPFSEIKNTSLAEKVKYYPSFVIYRKGMVIDYLDAESDKDINTYKNIESFEDWFKSYVRIKESNNNTKVDSSVQENIDNINFVLNNITYDENKVNIYFFWGDGCPHCKEELKFFDSIESEYGDYYNLHTFEVWYNEENKKIAEYFSSLMGDELNGIPYTIIGDQTFVGFAESSKDRMLDAIKSQYKNSYDVYFENKKD